MKSNKNINNNSQKEQEEILNYSLSSISLTINRDEFDKEKNFEIYIKDKDKLLKEYTFLKKIGQGTFGVVVLAIHKITNEKVAIKILDKEKINKNTTINRIKKEIDILKILRHNNIVHLYNVIDTLTNIFLIMEYINGIELFDYIIKNKRLDEYESCHFYQQIISGIEYLGKLNISHRDIKPENLLVDKDKKIKLVDFGLSNIFENDELLSTACGSPFYAAPEMIKGEKYNGRNVDIWSSGIVLYAMLCGYLPFEDRDNQKLYQQIIKGKLEFPSHLSNQAKDIISNILNVDPNKRYKISNIKKHAWFNLLNPKINMTEGLLINKYIIPFDENVISYISNKYKLNIEEIKINILLNKHNQLTTTYYLLINKKIRNNQETVENMLSDKFNEYIHNKKNLLSYYDNNIYNIINERIKIQNENKIKNMNEVRHYKSFNFDFFRLIPKYEKIINSSENYKKTKKIIKLENHNENNKNELKVTKININNIIIPKNFLNYTYNKNILKNSNTSKKDKINYSQNTFEGFEKKAYYGRNKNNIVYNNKTEELNKKEDIINNLKRKNIETVYINFNTNKFKSIQNSPISYKNKTYINKTKNNKNFLYNEIENDKKIKQEKNEIKFYLKRNFINENYTYNNTLRNSVISTPKLKEKYFTKSSKNKILTSYKKKKVLSFSFQKRKNTIINNVNNINNINNANKTIDTLTNNINTVRINKKNNILKKYVEGNCIKLMDSSEGKNFYSNNFQPKSKLFTYKKIKIPNISKISNISRRTDSVDSNKIEDKSSNLSVYNTYENFNKFQMNNAIIKKEKNIRYFNSMISSKENDKKENEILYGNPVIKHIYDRNSVNKDLRDNDDKQYENKNKNLTITNSIKRDKNIIFTKIKNNRKSDLEKNKIRKKNLIISNNISKNFNNTNTNQMYNNSFLINKNNSSNNFKRDINEIKNNNIFNDSLNHNLYLFKKPKVIINQKNIVLKNEIKKLSIQQNKNNVINDIKNNLNKYLYFQNINNKIYTPFDLHTLVYYNKENDIKDSLFKELNFKRVKFNEKKNKISCFKKDLRFELIIDKIGKNVFIINFLKKEERNYIYKDLFFEILDIYNKK